MKRQEPNFEGYWKCIEDLDRRQMSNSETYDKSLLTLSSAFLGLSLTFIKDVVKLDFACAVWVLYSSWAFFSLTIIVVISSFIYGQTVIETLKKGAKKYFMDGDKSEDETSRILAGRLNFINMISGVFFILGVTLITIFIGINARS